MIERVFSIFHKTLHPLLLVILRVIRKHQFYVINEHPSIDGNAIYAVNHSNRYDIYVCEAIKGIAMATLKWKTWEVCNDIGCKSLCEWNEEVERRIKEYPKLDYSYECSVIRKEFTSFDELIDISKISPNKHTAFLFRKD